MNHNMVSYTSMPEPLNFWEFDQLSFNSKEREWEVLVVALPLWTELILNLFSLPIPWLHIQVEH
jgi:hypothetical protein